MIEEPSEIILSRNPDVTITMTAESWLHIISAAQTCAELERLVDDKMVAAYRLLEDRFEAALKSGK